MTHKKLPQVIPYPKGSETKPAAAARPKTAKLPQVIPHPRKPVPAPAAPAPAAPAPAAPAAPHG
jgi:hypothetical protein